MVPVSAISLHQVNGLASQVPTFETSLQEAILQGDPERAAGLVLAARLEDKARIDAQQLHWLLERFADPVMVPCLAGACPDPIEVLAKFIKLHPDKSVGVSIFLVLGLLLEGQVIPNSVLRPARRFLKETPFAPTSPLAAALKLLDHRSLYAVGSSTAETEMRRLEPLVDSFRRSLAGDFRRLLFDPPNFEPVRRSSPKVGRNDPCPCGSGAKFKKCCQDKVVETAYQAWVQPKSINARRLPLHRLVQLNWEALDSTDLELVVEELAERGPITLAVDCFKALATRPDFRDESEDMLKVFLVQFCFRAERPEFLALLDWFAAEFPFSPWVELMRSSLKAAGKKWEGWLLDVLDNQGELADWAYCIRPYRPALSILFSRASFSNKIPGFEWQGRLDGLSEARSQLGLEEEDPFHAIAGPVEEEIPAAEPGENQELRALRQELEQAREQLKKAQSAKPAPAATVKTELVYVPDPQVDLLKSRVKELKQLVRERNEERADLRRSLKQQAPRTESNALDSFAPPTEETAEAESERYQPLEPIFSKVAQQQLRELPKATARLGLRLLGELAAGEPSAWGKCQRLQQTDDVFSTRLGREYRLLFRIEEKECVLRIEQMVHRSELERTIKSLRP